MGTSEAHNLKSEADILARLSRPQRNSTWVPKKRDWRYAKGVIQHDDFDDAPKSRSLWDTMDYNFQTGGRHSTPGSGRSRSGSVIDTSPSTAICKPMIIPQGLWRQVTRLALDIEAGLNGGEASYKVTGLIVRLRFTRKNKAQFKASVYTPHKLDSIESVHEFPLFKRVWIDETYDFNMATVRSKLRSANVKFSDIGANYAWYTDAVSIDAMFPPGVPISAKEISAFYPHHVRWKDVMIRLTNNGYRGQDIMAMQATDMNNFQRDVVRTAIPEFTTISYKGKSDRNLRTDQLTTGPYIHGIKKGHTVPTFGNLIRGLHRLPAGLDARGLTQCLSWYINMGNTFTPRLEMNVLHAQSLIRALREPLKPFGPQNLDRNALEQWRNAGTFETVEIENDTHQSPRAMTSTSRTQLHLNIDKHEVSMNLTLPIRHILTFPFLALHGPVCEAFKMGIDRAERRQEEADKRAQDTKRATKSATKINVKTKAEDNAPAELTTKVSKDPYRIPKRTRPVDTEQPPPHKKPYIPTRLRPHPIDTQHLAPHNIPTPPCMTPTPRTPTPTPHHPITPAPPTPYPPHDPAHPAQHQNPAPPIPSSTPPSQKHANDHPPAHIQQAL
ncbi:hypothetical protein BDU57DRAFT_457084 [Ampelomyces quisqualis]|uniref:Uncharacterized protein n=1 Tax=Ampelomyces quisqualis TaxID=50730 RepID=A0A6A5QBY3_AMPQU|nr:hypothetical protein BDU57DRAFT_457084 [Ampelomyces quisqualis]